MAPPTPGNREAAPGLTGTRAEAARRLKVGMGGLLSVLLVVAIASAILQSARDTEEPGSPAAGAESVAEPASDPLVDIGVAPEIPGKTQVIVPDLPAEQMPPEAREGMPVTSAKPADE